VTRISFSADAVELTRPARPQLFPNRPNICKVNFDRPGVPESESTVRAAEVMFLSDKRQEPLVRAPAAFDSEDCSISIKNVDIQQDAAKLTLRGRFTDLVPDVQAELRPSFFAWLLERSETFWTVAAGVIALVQLLFMRWDSQRHSLQQLVELQNAGQESAQTPRRRATRSRTPLIEPWTRKGSKR
jgi:hypothetical protein